MARYKQHSICGRVVNLTERPLNVYTHSGDIVTLEPMVEGTSFQAGTYFIVDADTYEEAKDIGRDTKYLVVASPEDIGRKGKTIVTLCRLDNFVRVYPMK